jgi:hypothetical protein
LSKTIETPICIKFEKERINPLLFYYSQVQLHISLLSPSVVPLICFYEVLLYTELGHNHVRYNETLLQMDQKKNTQIPKNTLTFYKITNIIKLYYGTDNARMD